MSISRRDFIRGGAVAAATATGMGGVVALDKLVNTRHDPTGAETIRELDVLASVAQAANEDVLVTMQRDLVKAMRKPAEERRWAMLIDTRKCVGCHACTIGCIAENKLPPGVVYRPVMTETTGSFPNVRMKFTPRPCMQCEEPSCVPVCPVHATWRRPDGIVVVDYDRCIGCRHCLIACPYGARTSDFGHSYKDGAAVGAGQEPERPLQGNVPAWEEKSSCEYGKEWDRSGHGSPVGNARKCHFCLHRLEVGELPMCVSTCIGRATYFGDKNDEEALLSRLLREHDTHKLLEHRKTRPAVEYII